VATCGIEILLNQCKVNRNLQFGLDMSRQIVQRRYVPSVGRRFHDLMQRTQREGDIEVWGIEKVVTGFSSIDVFIMLQLM